MKKLALILVVLLVGCGRLGYEPMKLIESNLRVDSGTPDSGQQVDQDARTVVLADSQPIPAPDASVATHDAGPLLPADAGHSPSTGCGRQGRTTSIWSFDNDVGIWDYTNPGPKPFWTALTGKNTQGALEVDSLPEPWNGHDGAVVDELHGWVSVTFPSQQDLHGQEFSAWAYLESGTSLDVQIYGSSPKSFYSTDLRTILPHVWTCFTMPIETSTTFVDFDPTEVLALGFGLNSVGPAKMYLDDVRIGF